MQPTYWQEAVTALSATDPVLANIITAYPSITLTTRGDAFHTLARSIVGQQISVKAADSIWNRFIDILPALTPAHVLDTNTDVLRSCGFSSQKVVYIKDLARHFESGELEPATWPALDDETLIKELCKVKGIGRWTAEMFLIFNLMRPDVYPVDDIGLQRAVERHYFKGEQISKKLLREIGLKWQPWRSVATWYLWRSLDPAIVAY